MTKLGKAVLFILPVILAYGQNLPAEYSISLIHYTSPYGVFNPVRACIMNQRSEE